ncbi:hypothetical protein GCM10009654_61010 [Streptomyces hebeiensis]|uniref:Immunity protein 35 domain-containing protein n=1 Tax=Streptomyces hebeiensis TaxID=229486 RepID=A0ABP4FS65_9ACTN
MISKNEALVAARSFVTASLGDQQYTIVMLPEESYERRLCWVVRFDTQESIDSGDPWKGPLTRVVVVPKDGSDVHYPPSPLPLDRYLDMVERGEWPPARNR